MLFHRHKWEPHPKSKTIKQLLSNFGIKVVKAERCTNRKCRKVRIHASTTQNLKVKLQVLPPFPGQEDNKITANDKQRPSLLGDVCEQ